MKKYQFEKYAKQFDDEDMDDQQEDGNESESEQDQQDLNALSPEEYAKLKQKKFGQRAVNDVDAIKSRLYEVKKSFYNRLESVRLIKK